MGRMAKHRAAAAALALALAGCAGTGDKSAMPTVSPEPPRSEAALRGEYAAHPEFRNQYGLERVKAHFAYARGATRIARSG